MSSKFAFAGVAAILAQALRSVAPDTAGIERDAEQQRQIEANTAAVQTLSDDVRSRLDAFGGALSELRTSLYSKGALDTSQQEALDALVGEMNNLADVLTGPAGDTTDNGVIGEVQAVPAAVDNPSQAVETVLDDTASSGVPVPEAILPEGGQDDTSQRLQGDEGGVNQDQQGGQGGSEERQEPGEE